jgi:hypothetical protein
MGLYRGDSLAGGAFFGYFDHVVGNRIGKKNNKIRIPYKTLQITLFLCKNLGFTVIFLAYILVPANHPVIPADNYNTAHVSLLEYGYVGLFRNQPGFGTGAC